MNGSTKCINVLLNSGANVNKVDPKGFTSLMLPAKGGHDGCVNLLIRMGADVNISNVNSMTAVLLAAEHGHVKSY